MTRIASLAAKLTTPLLPDDYLTLFNPLLTFESYRARVVEIHQETADSRTLHLRTGRDLPAHVAGQHLRVGVDLNAVRHWRSFSITSEASGRPSRDITVTVKASGNGLVSDHLVHRTRVGDIVHLETPSGEFTLPDQTEDDVLMIAGGSGVTPLLAMVRTLVRRDQRPHVTFVLTARTTQEMIARRELVTYSREHSWFDLILWPTSALGHFDGSALTDQVPDWAGLDAYVCGPAGMLTAVDGIWRGANVIDKLHLEQFQTQLTVIEGEGGSVTFAKSGRTARSDAGTPLLETGEDAGALMPSGCRIGICHTCVVPLRSGKVRDLRTGLVHGEAGDPIQTCINAAACDVELDV